VNLAEPSDVGLSHVPARLLAVLARTTGPMTLRQLARVSGVSLTRTQHWVHHWADRGVVIQQPAGRAIMCTLNREHILTASLVMLADSGKAMSSAIAAEISTWKFAPISVAAFGSFARGDGRVDSDIDLFVVHEARDVDAWHEQLLASAERLRLKLGNRIEWYDVTSVEWHNMKSAKEPLVAELASDVIHIFGDYLTLVGTPSQTR
jgi:predicted nucleotidyltransferase